MKRSPALAASLLLLVASGPLRAASVELRPGILVDAEADRAYVARPDGGLEALALENGQVVFVTAAAARPLAVAAGWLVCLAEPGGTGSLDLAFVSLAEPTKVQQLSFPVDPGVKASAVDGPGRSFEVVARQRGQALDLAWTARWQKLGPLPPEDGKAPSSETRGGVRIALPSLFASAVPWAEAAARDDGPVPASLAAFASSPGPFGPPVRTGDGWAVVETVRVDETRVRLVLRRATAQGSALAARTLFEGAAVVQLPSTDSRHVLIGARDERSPGRHVWSLFSLETGADAGLLGGTYSHAFFQVLPGGTVAYEARPETRMQGTLLVEEGRALVVARPGGGVVFRRAVRETAFTGPFPP